jgi:DNA-binding beta-propeller fold protein YncE
MVVLSIAILLVVPVLALWQQWGLWRYATYGTTNSVAISSDGSHLAVGVQSGAQSGKILLFDKSGSLLWTRDTDRVIGSVAISADGSHIAAGGYQLIGRAGTYENGIIYYLARDGSLLWNYTTGPSPNSGGLNVPIFAIGLSSDGTKILADTGYGIIFLNNNGQVQWTHLSPGGISHAAMSLDGTYVVTLDDRARAFDSQGRSLWNSSIIPPAVQNIALSPDGRYLAVDEETSSTNATLLLYNKTGALLRTQAFNSPPFSITFSADDGTMVLATGDSIMAFDSSGSSLWNRTLPSSGGSRIAVAPDGSHVLVGLWADWGQTVLIFDNHGSIVWGKPVGSVHQVALSSDGSFGAVAAGPPGGGPFSINSGSIYFLPGPRALARDTGPVYSLLYFGQNTGAIPPAIILPAATSAALIAITVVWERRRGRNNSVAEPGGPKTQTTRLRGDSSALSRR